MRYPDDFINQILCGDCLEVMKTIPDNSVDAVVTDPPYGLGRTPNIIEVLKDWLGKSYHEVNGGGFMGQKWDSFVPQPLTWKEIYRILKPGGHLLSFGGTRTYDWIVLGLRLAGFEIRDTIMWIYGSGFPKSNNISHSIDKKACREKLENKLGRRPTKEEFKEAWKNFREITGKYQLPDVADELRKKGWECSNTTEVGIFGVSGQQNITAPVTPEAKKWDGWGTALKPACEPIVVARKPLGEKTVAGNMLKWGTGGINIDEGRIPLSNNDGENAGLNSDKHNLSSIGTGATKFFRKPPGKNNEFIDIGRYPANVILDKEAGRLLDEQSEPQMHGAGASRFNQRDISGKARGIFPAHGKGGHRFGDKGGASRFFYCAKASKSERNKGCEGLEGKAIDIQQPHNGGNSLLKSKTKHQNRVETKGRYPANVIHDGSEEVVALFPNTGTSYRPNSRRGKIVSEIYMNGLIRDGYPSAIGFNDLGSAARFFYCAKASKKERNRGCEGLEAKQTDISRKEGNPGGDNPRNRGVNKVKNNHPTVKPISLMKYLVKLVTPPKGIVLDPFAGSGSTLIACKELGSSYIGIEKEKDYCEIARRRTKAIPESLF